MLTATLENRIKCGKCGTEFDLNKNQDGCPLCGFGKGILIGDIDKKITPEKNIIGLHEYIKIPPTINLSSGNVMIDDETQIWGSWLMFNDFFAPKFLSRIIIWKMYKEKKDYIILNELMDDAINIIKTNGLTKFKGFPNLNKDRKGERLVEHFLKTFVKMGLIQFEPVEKNGLDIWKANWDKIQVIPTKECVEFAQIKNKLFDEKQIEQILNLEEKDWLLNYLKKIDEKGYKEYSTLKEVYLFLKDGNNGNKDLWNWFVKNNKFQSYIEQRSKSKDNPELFEKQIWNYARSFSSAKISLLREFGVVKNKRNDYTILGEFE